MKIHTDREIEIFDAAYKLGFHAGQLDWRKHMIADSQRRLASIGGEQIATRRGNISLEEYGELLNLKEEENDNSQIS